MCKNFPREAAAPFIATVRAPSFALLKAKASRWCGARVRSGTRFEIKPGSIYSPGDLMYHGHFNTGSRTLRHFAMRGRSPKFSQDRFRTKLHEMIPFEEEPPEVHPMFLAELKRKGVKSEISVVEE